MKFAPKQLQQDLDEQDIQASTEVSISQRPTELAGEDAEVFGDDVLVDNTVVGIGGEKSNDWVLAVVVVAVLVTVLGACVLYRYVVHKRRKRSSLDRIQHDALASCSGTTVDDMNI